MTRDLVRGLTPFVHVSQIERSIAFYETLGLTVERTFPPDGRATWAYLRNGDARVMLQQVDEEVDGAAQAVLFYLFVDDLLSLRERLIGHGVEAGEIEDGRPGPTRELRLRDPDGYLLMVAEIEAEEAHPPRRLRARMRLMRPRQPRPHRA
jgi:catechol 2,3-dioxygenase-like lactoylglutathione lyase family enzyme